MRRRLTFAVAGVVMAAALTVAAAPPGLAEPAADPVLPTAAATRAPLPPDYVAAMMRDLHLTEPEVYDRLDREDAAHRIRDTLQTRLGSAYGGAWIADDGRRLTVAVTDVELAPVVRAAGAIPELVRFSEGQLRQFGSMVEQSDHSDAVTGVSLDVQKNTLIVHARDGRIGAAEAVVDAVVEASGVGRGSVRVDADGADVQATSNFDAGSMYSTRSGRFLDDCSTGFGVVTRASANTANRVLGHLTAGHCGTARAVTVGANPTTSGQVEMSTFPGVDHGWVRSGVGSTPTPFVRSGGGSTIGVTGMRLAMVGDVVCRSGFVSGYNCGRVIGVEPSTTVGTSAGSAVVHGLVRASVCAENGDSGGPVLNGTLAVGIVSARRIPPTPVPCDQGESFFQQVIPALNAYGLDLLTVGGGGFVEPPIAQITFPSFYCGQVGADEYRCSVDWAGGTGPFIVSWAADGLIAGGRITVNEELRRTTRYGPCAPNTINRLTVSVIDSTGANASQVMSVFCRPRGEL
ncbi:S1 family peptidase [Parafrankia sp. FMc2]|uniref:S1 family peptidase n=1 Tax=Parafrankia sp. FMc2 TaxID=3233196 RepID=UPI0034D47E09